MLLPAWLHGKCRETDCIDKLNVDCPPQDVSCPHKMWSDYRNMCTTPLRCGMPPVISVKDI
jgi:hypothetical protein